MEYDDYPEAQEEIAEYLEQECEPEPDDLGDTREPDWLASGGRANYRGRR